MSFVVLYDTPRKRFNPLSLSPALWYDASAITGLNDGDGIATWSDLSGNARHAIQATPGLRPLYKINILNGKPGALVDGTDDILLVTYSIPTLFSCFIVYSGRTGTNGSIIGNNGAVSDLLQRNATNFPSTVDNVIALSQNMNDNKILTMIFDYTAPSFFVRLDGAAVGSSVAAATAITAGSVSVGQTNNEAINGYLHEILFYPSLLSNANRDAVEVYLGAKWGVTLG